MKVIIIIIIIINALKQRGTCVILLVFQLQDYSEYSEYSSEEDLPPRVTIIINFLHKLV